MTKKIINSWTGFQPLEEVWLGSCYPRTWAEYFTDDKQRQSILLDLFDTANNELDNFETIMEENGIKVRRPNFPENPKHIEDSQRRERYRKKWLKPMITPRDDFIVYGNTLWLSGGHLQEQVCDWWGDTIKEYINAGEDVRWCHGAWNDQLLDDYESNVICGAKIVRLGKRIIIEKDETHNEGHERFASILKKQYPDHQIDLLVGDGRHTDGRFAVLRPYVILHSYDRGDYTETFSNQWKAIHVHTDLNKVLDDEEAKRFGVSRDMMDKQKQKWYANGREQDQESYQFIDKYLKDWSGDVRETLFDVNCLVHNENHVFLINDPPKEIRNELRQLKIEYTKVPWTHRWFFDGGLHCNTLDIRRTGNAEWY